MDVTEQQQRADFMEHLYEVYKPTNHLYTGLWERFCLTEAGPYAKAHYFEMLEAVRLYEQDQLPPV